MGQFTFIDSGQEKKTVYSNINGATIIEYMGDGYMVCKKTSNSEIDDHDFVLCCFDCFGDLDHRIDGYFICLEIILKGKKYQFYKSDQIDFIKRLIVLSKPYEEELMSIYDVIGPYRVNEP